jgi:redox-sensitive bicupin YhaK (pirin superfamily)
MFPVAKPGCDYECHDQMFSRGAEVMSGITEGNPDAANEKVLEVALQARTRELAPGVTVRRLLPAAARRMVGPFIFFDHLGPLRMDPGNGLDVRPHPHINLATVTYLFEGEILHRDSIGSEQPITPGAVNWMTAGRGIVHSERSPSTIRKTGPTVHGLQLWVALPKAYEEIAPSFQHCKAEDIPMRELKHAHLRVIAGSAYGVTSPVRVFSPLFYVEAYLQPHASLQLPDDYVERAVYLVDGIVSCDGVPHSAGEMLVFLRNNPAEITAMTDARVMLLGGDPLDGERYIWWNFVSSSQDRIQLAKNAWQDRQFPTVPGDEAEFIPLPDERK